jgi:DNA gyrase subunit A
LADNDQPPGSGAPSPSDIRPISLIDEMKRSYLDYAMSVIVARALPDVRDGLKPVHRRILYFDAREQLHADRAYNKSARVTGDTMGSITRTATRRSTTRWCAWRRNSPCACR